MRIMTFSGSVKELKAYLKKMELTFDLTKIALAQNNCKNNIKRTS